MAAPLGVRAQQSTSRRIAVVHPSTPATLLSSSGGIQHWRAFYDELARRGFVEGSNLIVEQHSAEGQTHLEPALAQQVVKGRQDVILAISTRLVGVFKNITHTVPIVGITGDPVVRGLATNLSRPEGNITGVVVDAGVEIWAKRLSLLKELVPSATRIGHLTPKGAVTTVTEEMTQAMGFRLIRAWLESPVDQSEYTRVFELLARERIHALSISDASENLTNLTSILHLVSQYRLPSIFCFREFTAAGGLMAYAIDLVDLYRHAGRQVAELLRGARVGDLPFYRATKFDLIINLKTAKALKITVPPSLLARADEVIE
jgi:putative ABC transport system substrate-binding protein